jgi:hypothetical protein
MWIFLNWNSWSTRKLLLIAATVKLGRQELDVMTASEQCLAACVQNLADELKVCQDMLQQGLQTSIGCGQIILRFQAIKRISILFNIQCCCWRYKLSWMWCLLSGEYFLALLRFMMPLSSGSSSPSMGMQDVLHSPSDIVLLSGKRRIWYFN